MQQTKAWYHTVPGLFHAEKPRNPPRERTGFLARHVVTVRAPNFHYVRLKSAKNLYFRHRFFNKIRQIHRFFYIFRQKLQIL